MAKKKWYNYSDYQKALEQVLKDLPPVIVVEGEEEYLRHMAIERIQKKIMAQHPQAAEVVFYGPAVQGEGKFDFSELLVELGSASLFSSEKVVVFRRAQRTLFIAPASTDSGRKIPPVQSLAEYIANPSADNFLVIEVEKINKQRKIGKVLNKQMIVPCPVLNRQHDVISWMHSEAQQEGKELDMAAAEILHRSYGSDLGVLASEINKLSLYVAGEHIITSGDVQEFISGTVEFSIFELTAALERRDIAKAMHFGRLICEQGSRDQSGKRQDGLSSAHQSMALIASLLENLVNARAMIAEQRSVSEIVSELGMHPARAEKMVNAAKNFTIEELLHALNIMAQEMKSAHDTGADPKFSLEKVITAICRKRCVGI